LIRPGEVDGVTERATGCPLKMRAERCGAGVHKQHPVGAVIVHRRLLFLRFDFPIDRGKKEIT
jgi:hypothetical protein